MATRAAWHLTWRGTACTSHPHEQGQQLVHAGITPQLAIELI
jgi:hypothetical protein